MRKSLLALAAAAALLASCGSSKTVSASASAPWATGSLSMSVPKGWTKLEGKDVILPSQGSFVMGMRGTEKFGEYENLNVVADDLANPVPSADYADTNFTLMSAKLASGLPLTTVPFRFNDGTAGKVRVFEGKYNASTNLKRYVQTARVCGKKAYVATFTLAATTKDTTNYEAMLKTFDCAAKAQ